MLDGVDDLAAAVRAFQPGPGRRIGVLVDHLVEGTKEWREAAAGRAGAGRRRARARRRAPLRRRLAGGEAPAARARRLAVIPKGTSWKHGSCRRWAGPCRTQVDVAAAWRRILGTVRDFTDLEPDLLGRVEELIDSRDLGRGRRLRTLSGVRARNRRGLATVPIGQVTACPARRRCLAWTVSRRRNPMSQPAPAPTRPSPPSSAAAVAVRRTRLGDGRPPQRLSSPAYVALGFLGPLVVRLAVGQRSPYVHRHATEALNFNLSILLYLAVAVPLCLLLIGIPIAIGVGVTYSSPRSWRRSRAARRGVPVPDHHPVFR